MVERDDILKLLGDVKNRNLLVIVEGIKDRDALNSFGIVNVVVLNKPLFAVVEDVASKVKAVVLLTDLDDEGKKLYSELSTGLQSRGVRIDNRLRELLFRTPLRHIEGLDSFLSNLD